MSHQKKIIMYGTIWCSDCHRSREFLDKQRIPYEWVDVEQDAKAMAYVTQVNQGQRRVPTILFPDGSILVEPSDAELGAKLGLATEAS